MKMKYLKLLTVLFCTGVLSANAQILEVSGFQNPESVVAYGDKLFVSNMGVQLDPTAKDGDGFISMASRKDGKIIEEKFITGLNSPKGLQAKGGIIVVADVDKIIAFSIKTKKKVWEADLSKQGITYANDMTKRCGSAFVSSTDKNAIYKVCHNGSVKKWMVKGDLPGANGLAHSCSKVFVANYGREAGQIGSFGKIGKCSKKFTAFQTGGMYDGIVKVGHQLVVSDWVSQNENKGRIVTYNLCKKTSSVLNIGRAIDGPADLYADCKTKTVWVAAMRENKILGIPYLLLKDKKK